MFTALIDALQTLSVHSSSRHSMAEHYLDSRNKTTRDINAGLEQNGGPKVMRDSGNKVLKNLLQGKATVPEKPQVKKIVPKTGEMTATQNSFSRPQCRGIAWFILPQTRAKS